MTVLITEGYFIRTTRLYSGFRGNTLRCTNMQLIIKFYVKYLVESIKTESNISNIYNVFIILKLNKIRKCRQVRGNRGYKIAQGCHHVLSLLLYLFYFFITVAYFPFFPYILLLHTPVPCPAVARWFLINSLVIQMKEIQHGQTIRERLVERERERDR